VLTASGYAVTDPKNYLVCVSPPSHCLHEPREALTQQDFKLTKYELEPLADDRITVAVECCGVCGSDHHTITGGWGPWVTEFIVPGHEVIGKVVEIGSKVTEFKVGQRVGVGAQVASCMKCKPCLSDNGVWRS
jgi:alcohol dehydrogenase (NADP+)